MEMQHNPPRLKIHFLASGSKGNCTIVEGPSSSLMIDAGVTRTYFKKAVETCKTDPRKISQVFITHDHSDHVRCLGVLLRYFKSLHMPTPNVYVSQDCFNHIRDFHDGKTPCSVQFIHADSSIRCGEFQLQAFPLSHDSHEPLSCSVQLLSNDGVVDSYAHITDTGFLTAEALTACYGARILGLESNHEPDMLWDCGYPYHVKQRIFSDYGHLSNDQSGAALTSLVSRNTQQVIALHISENSNDPAYAIQGFQKALSPTPFNPKVYYAYQHKPLSICD